MKKLKLLSVASILEVAYTKRRGDQTFKAMKERFMKSNQICICSQISRTEFCMLRG